MRRSLLAFLVAGAWVIAGCGDPTFVSCPEGLAPCGDGCADMTADPTNCGLCGQECAQGDACVAGMCMPAQAGACAINNGGCHPNALCMDLGGSVACSCLPGFTGDGMQCAACSTCTPGEFLAAPCGPTMDAVCTTCTTCGSETYASVPCSATADAVCATCTSACTGGFFEALPCTPTSDRACAPCSTCPMGTYTSGECIGTQDTQCTACQTGCLACLGPGATCSMCDLGYVLVAGSCEVPVCGNAVVEPGEQCDDGNMNPGDGCSAMCAVEAGYYCFGEAPSLCRAGDCIVDPLMSLTLDPGLEINGTSPTPVAGLGLMFTQRAMIRTTADVAYPLLVEVDVTYSGDDLTFVGSRGPGLPDTNNNDEPTDTLRAQFQQSTGALSLVTGINTVIGSTTATFTPQTNIPYHVRYVDDGNSASVEWINTQNPTEVVSLQQPSSFHGGADRAFVGGGDTGGVAMSNLRVCSAPLLPVTAGLVGRYSAIPSWTAVRNISDVLTTWKDDSGNGHDLAANGTGPTFNPGLISGNRPGLDFSSGAGLMSNAFALTTDVTVFMVFTQRTPAQWGALAHHGSRDDDWSLEQDGGGDPSTLHWQTNNDNTNMQMTLTANRSYVIVGRFAGNDRYLHSYDLFTGGTKTVSITDASHTITAGSKKLYLGLSDANEASNAYIADVVYFARALSDAERDQVFSYLTALWGTP